MNDNGGTRELPLMVVAVQTIEAKMYLGRMGWAASADGARKFKSERQAYSALGAFVVLGALCGHTPVRVTLEVVGTFVAVAKANKAEGDGTTPTATEPGKRGRKPAVM